MVTVPGILIKKLVVPQLMSDVRIVVLVKYGMFKKNFVVILETTLADAKQLKYGILPNSFVALLQTMPALDALEQANGTFYKWPVVAHRTLPANFA